MATFSFGDRGFAALPESANGPDLPSEVSIGIVWTTNKLNHLRFDSTSLRVHLQAAIKGYLAAHRCVWPTISVPLNALRGAELS